ncbi:zinc finger, CCHC-type containing protein [Tanacetum coccineum]
MDEQIQVSCIIDKLPPSWKAFKHTLKHLNEELTLVELGSHQRIEESLRVLDNDKPKGNNVVGPLVFNMVEYNNSSRYNDNTGKRKNHDNKRADPNKKAKPTYWKCGKTNHIKRNCKCVNVGNKANGLGTKGSMDGSSNSLKARLGHVHFKRMQDMFKDGLILAFDMDTEKYKTCMLSKITKKQFQNVKRETEVLELIHVDLVVIRLSDPKLKTLDERGIKCIFIGYAEHSKPFRFYVIEPNGLVSIKSIFELKNAIFDENRFSSVPRPSLRIPNGTEYIGGLVVTKEDDPKTFDEAMKSQDVAFWKETINDEMNSIMGNNTLIDMKTALLNGELDEEIDEVILSSGYLLNQANKCVYRKFDETSKRVIICLYVDDMLIFGTDQVQVDLTKESVSSRFSMKDMGEADVIFGIRIKHESSGIAITQSYYIEKVLKKFNYFDCTLVSTPTDASEKLMPNNGQVVSQLEYSRVIGCFMYVMTWPRPDIAFVVGKLSMSMYTSNPGTQH